jgi:hypothetical protein
MISVLGQSRQFRDVRDGPAPAMMIALSRSAMADIKQLPRWIDLPERARVLRYSPR